MEDRWWSPEPQRLRLEEEDEEDNHYINSILSRNHKVKNGAPEQAESCTEVQEAETLIPQGQETVSGLPSEVEGEQPISQKHQECVIGSWPSATGKPKRRELRKRVVCGEQETWETVRRDAWLRNYLRTVQEMNPTVGSRDLKNPAGG
jgi:hypothetical protein